MAEDNDRAIDLETDETATVAEDPMPAPESVADEPVANHPRAQGAPSASINDQEYREAAIDNDAAVDDDSEVTEPGFPVPVIKDDAAEKSAE